MRQVCLAVVILAACDDPVPVGPPPESGWARHESANGSVDLPDGWTASWDGVWLNVTGDGGERMSYRPFFVAGRVDGASAVRAMARERWGEAQWDAPQASSGAVRMSGRAGSTAGTAVVTLAPAANGTAGAFYLVSAPEGRYAASVEKFADVMSSVRPVGPPVEDAAAVSYVTWRDPNQGAFTVEVPEGWTVEGGAQQTTPLLVQAYVEATSSDGGVVIYMGDNFPIFFEPNQVLAMAGIGEGGTYTDGMGHPWPVRSYRAGVRCFTEFILPELDRRAQAGETQPRPDLTRDLNQSSAAYGIPSQYDAGSVEFRLTREGQARVGGAVCVTMIYDGGVSRVWHVWRLYYFDCTPGREAEALEALNHLAGSMQIDPDWARAHGEAALAQSRIISEMSDSIRTTVSSSFEYRSQVQDDLSARRERAILGVEDYADPATGGTLRLENTSNYYWMDHQGQVVGTTTDTAPGVDWRPLLQMP